MKQLRENNYVDFVKGCLVILIIVGHCMSFGFSNTLSLDYVIENNYLYRMIYSFHMPLFMMISGFFTYKSIKKKTFKNAIESRFKQLIFPLLLIAILTSLPQLNNGFIEQVVYKFLYNFWFGWAVFYYTIMVYIIDKVMGKKLFYLLVFFLLYFTKIPNSTVLNFEIIFFLIGYYYSKSSNKFLNTIFNKDNFLFTFLSFIGFCAISFFFSSKMPIHVTGVFNEFSINNIQLNIIRWMIGIINSLFFLFLMKRIYSYINSFINSIICFFGQKSYEFYIIHCYLVQSVLSKLAIRFNISFNYEILIIEVVITIFFTVIIYLIIMKFYILLKKIIRKEIIKKI